jgi:hypothetical protein
MAYTSKQSARNNQAAEESAVKQATAQQTAPAFSDQRASTSVQLKQQQMMNASDTNPLQRVEDEELLQGKFETAQLMEDEEPLQGKFAPAQLMEEEEPLQGKFETAQLAEEEELLQGKFSSPTTAQLEEKPNNTGLPNQLKSGIESLSGMSMDGVKVHYNSDKPAQLNAHAYAQGTEIHVAPGQEQHLPHEAWHVVQQAQGRVKPTMQMKAGVPVNDDAGLESEADVMGAKAMSIQTKPAGQLKATEVRSANFNSDMIQPKFTFKKKQYDNKSSEKDLAKVKVHGIKTATIKLLAQNEHDFGVLDKKSDFNTAEETLKKINSVGDGASSSTSIEVEQPIQDDGLEKIEIQKSPDQEIQIAFSGEYNSKKNPCVSVDLMLLMKDRGELSIEEVAYRNNMIANGFKYFFTWCPPGGPKILLGEWHVHWNAKKEAGTPGWKKGKDGEKQATGNEMRPLLFEYWGGKPPKQKGQKEQEKARVEKLRGSEELNRQRREEDRAKSRVKGLEVEPIESPSSTGLVENTNEGLETDNLDSIQMQIALDLAEMYGWSESTVKEMVARDEFLEQAMLRVNRKREDISYIS